MYTPKTIINESLTNLILYMKICKFVRISYCMFYVFVKKYERPLYFQAKAHVLIAAVYYSLHGNILTKTLIKKANPVY